MTGDVPSFTDQDPQQRLVAPNPLQGATDAHFRQSAEGSATILACRTSLKQQDS